MLIAIFVSEIKSTNSTDGEVKIDKTDFTMTEFLYTQELRGDANSQSQLPPFLNELLPGKYFF